MDLLSVFLALQFFFSAPLFCTRHRLLVFFTEIIRGGDGFYGQPPTAQNFSTEQCGYLFQDLDCSVLVSQAVSGAMSSHTSEGQTQRFACLHLCPQDLLLFHDQMLYATDYHCGSGNQCWILLMIPGTVVL